MSEMAGIVGIMRLPGMASIATLAGIVGILDIVRVVGMAELGVHTFWALTESGRDPALCQVARGGRRAGREGRGVKERTASAKAKDAHCVLSSRKTPGNSHCLSN
jgi:hypothetical protein